MYCVYMHTCPNGKVYIGITGRTPQERWLGRYRNNKHFSNAIRKYGWCNIKHDVLYTGLTKPDAEKIEIELIEKFKSTDPECGYNIAKGGHSNNGYHHSDETKKKISNSLSGVKHTDQRKKKQSDTSIKLWLDPEYRKRVSEAHIGKYSGADNPLSKRVSQYSVNGDYIKTFESINEAERELNISHQQISDCCRGKQATCHGYVWIFERK